MIPEPTPVFNTARANVSDGAEPLSGLERAQAYVVGLAIAATKLGNDPGDLVSLIFVSQVLHDAQAHPLAQARAREIANSLWPGKPYPNPAART